MRERTIKSWRRLSIERRAVASLMAAILIPGMLSVGALSIATGYLYYRSAMIRQTVTAAALAGASRLTTYYTSGTGDTSAVVSAAQAFATLNAPSQTYGTIVPANNVVIGNWDPTSSTFVSLASSKGTTPNAVQITGLATKANGNAIPVLFGSILGMSSVDMTRTAVASFGTGQNFDTIILNDLSQSFSSEIKQQAAADLAILNCVKNTSASTSMFGITTFDGHPNIYQTLIQASTNMPTLTTKINALNSCGNSGTPACSGSNAAAGLYSAIQQFSTVPSANTVKNIILITDGVPNASSSTTYGPTDGVTTCTTKCTDAQLLAAAQTQAKNAYAAGISVSTIYYSGDTAANQQSSYAASLATLRQGTGVSLVAPTSAKITSVFGGFCATMNSALVSLN